MMKYRNRLLSSLVEQREIIPRQIGDGLTGLVAHDYADFHQTRRDAHGRLRRRPLMRGGLRDDRPRGAKHPGERHGEPGLCLSYTHSNT